MLGLQNQLSPVLPGSPKYSNSIKKSFIFDFTTIFIAKHRIIVFVRSSFFLNSQSFIALINSLEMHSTVAQHAVSMQIIHFYK